MFPYDYYKIQYQFGQDTTVDFVMIDTVELCGNTRDIKYAKSAAEVMAMPEHEPFGPENIWAAETQWNWIETQLVTSKCMKGV